MSDPPSAKPVSPVSAKRVVAVKPKPPLPAKPSPLRLYLSSTAPRLHRPSSRWTAIIWLALTGAVVLASSGGFVASVVEAYWAGVQSYQPTLAGSIQPANGAVAVGSGNPQTTIGGSPIQSASPTQPSDGGIGTGTSTIFNPATQPDIGVGAPAGAIGAGGPTPSGYPLGQWRYGRVGEGELVG